jgi:hypothetical protein
MNAPHTIRRVQTTASGATIYLYNGANVFSADVSYFSAVASTICASKRT